MSQDCPRPEAGSALAIEQDNNSRKEFVSMKDYGKSTSFPCLATIHRKSETKSRNAGKTDSEDVYIHSIATVTDAVAEEVRFNAQGKRIVVKQQKFLIPIEYDGWFEVISQDGRSTRPIETVKELSGSTAPSYFLVRQTVNGYRQTGDGACATEVTRGEVLKTQETVQSLARAASDGSCDKDLIKGPLLKCLDRRGSQIYLSLEVRGLFSPIACRSSIVGAHDIRSLLEKFRLPVLVRLIHGNISKMESIQSTGGSPKIFRLLGKYSEDVAFVLLLNSKQTVKDACDMLPLPANDKYMLSQTKHLQSATTMGDGKMKCLQKHCGSLISDFKNAIRSSPYHKRHWLMSDKALELDLIEKNKLNTPDINDTSVPIPLTYEEQRLFREIEDLYADVRNPRHQSAPPKLRFQRHDPAELTETTKFPTSFKMVSFSNGAFVGRPVLFSRNPVFHGNLEKSNPKQTFTIREPGQHSPPLMGARRGRKGGNDDVQIEKTKQQTTSGNRSVGASKENLYEEIVTLKPNNTADKEPLWTPNTLRKHKLEMINSPKNAEPEQQNKYTKVQRTINRPDGSCETLKTQRNLHTSNTYTTTNRIREGNIDNKDQVPHSVDRRKSTSVADRDNGPFQRESYAQTSFRIDQTWDTKPVLLRPKSYAGTPHADQQLTAFLGPAAITSPAPSPKRVASLTEVNVLSELPHRNELTVSSGNQLHHDQRRMSTSTTNLSLYRDANASSGFNRNLPTNRTIGNASRSLVNTIRRIGNKSTFTVNAENRPISSKDADAAFKNSKNSTARAKPEQRLRIRSANDDSFPSFV